MLRMKKDEKQTLFVGRVLRCPMCGQWMVRSTSIFQKIYLVAGEVECGRCGAVVSFGGKADGKEGADNE